MSQRKPYPKNVDGPFYVEDGCCISCGVWAEEGSEFLRLEQESEFGWHCYFYRQPKTEADYDKVFAAIGLADVTCMRYRGSDPEVLQRMLDRGEGPQCDYLEN